MSKVKKGIGSYFAVIMGICSIITMDQLTKTWVVNHIQENQIGYSYFWGFFRLIHVRNLGMAFSLGNTYSQSLRAFLFIFLPLIFLLILVYYLFKDITLQKKFSSIRLNRLALVLIIGGGLGNLFDRVFRHGVVDFIDIQFFGLFGLQRWPAFNLADSSVFLGACCWVILSLIPEKKIKESSNEKHQE